MFGVLHFPPLCSRFMYIAVSRECDDYNNSEACGYDGGDCCECSCVPGLFDCGRGGYDCADPEYIAECPTRPTPTPFVPVIPEPEVQTSRSSLEKLRDSSNIGRALIAFIFVSVVVFSVTGVILLTIRKRKSRRAAGIIDASSNPPKIVPVGDEYDHDDPQQHDAAESSGETKSERSSKSPASVL